MSGRALLALGALCACVLVLYGVCVFVSRDNEGRSAPLTSNGAGPTSPVGPAPLSLPQSSGRSPADPQGPAESGSRNAGSPASPNESPSSGLFVFSDGSSPPEMTFEVCPLRVVEASERAELIQKSREADLLGTTREWAIERSRADGTFVLERMKPGQYAVVLRTFAGLGPVVRPLELPAVHAPVHLDGYLVRFFVHDASGAPIQNADLGLSYVMNGKANESRVLPARTDKDGLAHIALRDAGECVVSASVGLSRSEEIVFVLQGPSHVQAVDVPVGRRHLGGSLIVDVRSCDNPQVRVLDYCIALYAIGASEPVARQCSKDTGGCDPFEDLAPGDYLAQAVPKYSGRPVFYLPTPNEGGTRVVVREGLVSTADLCVKLGGRLSVEIDDGSQTQSVGAAEYSVTVREGDVGADIPITFRTPDDTGVTVSRYLLPRVPLMSETVLRPGNYVLTVSHEGSSTYSSSLTVTPGEVTKIVCVFVRPR